MNEAEFRSRFRRAVGEPPVPSGLGSWLERKLQSKPGTIAGRWVGAAVAIAGLVTFVVLPGNPAGRAVGSLVGHHDRTVAAVPTPSAIPTRHEPSPMPQPAAEAATAVANARADAEKRTGVPASQWEAQVGPVGSDGVHVAMPCPNLPAAGFPAGTRYLIVLTAKDQFMLYTSGDGATAIYWWGSDSLDKLKGDTSLVDPTTSLPSGSHQAIANAEADAQRRTGIPADGWQVHAFAIPVPTQDGAQCPGMRTGYLIQLFAPSHSLAYRSDDGTNVSLLADVSYNGPTAPGGWPTPPAWPRPTLPIGYTVPTPP